MTSLTLKRAKLSRSSGQWQDEDYDVLADGKVLERIYEDAHRSPADRSLERQRRSVRPSRDHEPSRRSASPSSLIPSAR
jgi:hypothetical protein